MIGQYRYLNSNQQNNSQPYPKLTKKISTNSQKINKLKVKLLSNKMHNKNTQYKQINKFLSSFTIIEHTQGSTILASQSNTYLIRNIQISSSNEQQKEQELNEIIMTLSTHQSFNCKNILPLINFDIVFNRMKTQSQIRAVYHHGRKQLSNEIQQRKESDEYFDQDALWSLLYSLASPLAYLQQKSIIYGVLDPARVFLDNDVITIMDPSSTGVDPYEIMPNRLYSPQLLKPQTHYSQTNMFKSDVFALGLIMLQCSLLKLELYDYDDNILQICLTGIKELYSQGFCQLIQSMLNIDPDQRPSFDEILMHVNEIFEIATDDLGFLQSAVPDEENQFNQICQIGADSETENIDILQTQYIRFEDQHNSTSNSFSDKAQLRFYHHSNHHQLTESPINQSSEISSNSQNSSLFIQQSMVKSIQKSRRVNKPKEIKEKLIKNDYESCSSLERSQTVRNEFSQNNTHNKNQSHRRTKTDYDNNLLTSSFHKQNINSNGTKLKQSKENHSHNQHFSSGSTYSPLNKENLFTKPEIMNMIKYDMKKIQEKKKFSNVNFCYMPQNNQQKCLRQVVKNNQQSTQKALNNQSGTRSFHQISINSKRR